jgi:hypothetical protein
MLEQDGAILQHLLLEAPNNKKCKIGLMFLIRNLENEGIDNNTSSLSVLMPKRQKSLVGDVIPRGVKEEDNKEDSKVSIKDKVDIKDKVGSEDDVFPLITNIQVRAKQTASGGKKSSCGRRKIKS